MRQVTAPRPRRPRAVPAGGWRPGCPVPARCRPPAARRAGRRWRGPAPARGRRRRWPRSRARRRAPAGPAGAPAPSRVTAISTSRPSAAGPVSTVSWPPSGMAPKARSSASSTACRSCARSAITGEVGRAAPGHLDALQPRLGGGQLQRLVDHRVDAEELRREGALAREVEQAHHHLAGALGLPLHQPEVVGQPDAVGVGERTGLEGAGAVPGDGEDAGERAAEAVADGGGEPPQGGQGLAPRQLLAGLGERPGAGLDLALELLVEGIQLAAGGPQRADHLAEGGRQQARAHRRSRAPPAAPGPAGRRGGWPPPGPPPAGPAGAGSATRRRAPGRRRPPRPRTSELHRKAASRASAAARERSTVSSPSSRVAVGWTWQPAAAQAGWLAMGATSWSTRCPPTSSTLRRPSSPGARPAPAVWQTTQCGPARVERPAGLGGVGGEGDASAVVEEPDPVDAGLPPDVLEDAVGVVAAIEQHGAVDGVGRRLRHQVRLLRRLLHHEPFEAELGDEEGRHDDQPGQGGEEAAAGRRAGRASGARTRGRPQGRVAFRWSP